MAINYKYPVISDVSEMVCAVYS